MLQVEEIHENSSFGDYEVCNGEETGLRMINSIITTLPSEIVHVPYFQILDNLSLEEVKQIQLNANPYPQNGALLKTYLENLCWEEFKTMLSREVR